VEPVPARSNSLRKKWQKQITTSVNKRKKIILINDLNELFNRFAINQKSSTRRISLFLERMPQSPASVLTVDAAPVPAPAGWCPRGVEIGLRFLMGCGEQRKQTMRALLLIHCYRSNRQCYDARRKPLPCGPSAPPL
jgi:hypothetical protein